MSRTGPAWGVIDFDKPAGCTSHDAVDFLRRLLPRKTKVGHAGTLDPAATGVLPLLVGPATRLAAYLSGAGKTYRVQARLDCRTDTADMDGTVVERFAPSEPPSRPSLEAAMAAFRGPIRQRPPMYSAVRIGGRRCHEMAREGLVVERPERDVTIHSLVLVHYLWPRLDLTMDCSSGTYVRSLVEDLGAALGVGGTVVVLRRERVGLLDVAAAHRPADLVGAALREDWEPFFVPWSQALPGLGRATVSGSALERVRHGGPLTEDQVEGRTGPPTGAVALFTVDDELLAVYRSCTGCAGLVAEKVLVGAV